MTLDKQESYISVRKFGLAWGLSFALFFFVFGITSATLGIWTEAVELCSKVYIGFEPSFIGSIKGALWGLVEGTVAGTVIAFIYNRV